MATMNRKLKDWISARRYKPPRPRLESPQQLHYYPDAMPYHVTLGPVFNARQSLTASTSIGYVLSYATTKLAAMYNKGDYHEGDTMYVWDLNAPSGASMPFAKFQIVDGEVRRC